MKKYGLQEGALTNGMTAPSRGPREHVWTCLQLGYTYKSPIQEQSHQTVADLGPGRPVSFHCFYQSPGVWYFDSSRNGVRQDTELESSTALQLVPRWRQETGARRAARQ